MFGDLHHNSSQDSLCSKIGVAFFFFFLYKIMG